MAMGAPTAMPTDPAHLTLAQWFSPSYPVGAFSYSHGLEAAVDGGQVRDAAELQDWIGTVLNHGGGRSDALFLAAAHHAQGDADLHGIDATCRAFAPSAERLLETERQGAAFCATTAEIWGLSLTALTYPVAAGRAVRLCGLDLQTAASFYLHAFVANLAVAGQRLAAIGQGQAQRIIRDLAPHCRRIARDTESGDLETLSGTTFLADIASMTHETQYSRMFQT